jgi:hypothetical protein
MKIGSTLLLQFIFTLPLLTTASLAFADPESNPIEVGHVKWQHDLDAARAASKQSGKPLFVLFQEIPGCAGCQKFGAEVLTQPLLVDAIENEFIPVLVYNNRNTGPDLELLKQFNEPAWNYQVIRFLDHNAKDIIPRKDRIWTADALAARMIETLEKSHRPVPPYLKNITAFARTTPQKPASYLAPFQRKSLPGLLP